MPKVLIVGGGILGTAHALEAIDRGFEVEQFEADAEPRASTPRSPGAMHFSWAAGGLDLELCLRAARDWAALDDGDAFLRPTGSQAVASTDAEHGILRELMDRPDAQDRGWRLLGRAETEAMNPALTGDYLASLHSEIDMLIEPRMALDHLGSRLQEYEAFRFFGGREIRDFGADSVTDATGQVHRGDLVLLCPGMRSDLSATALSQPPVVRAIRLQVVQTERLPAKLSAPVSDVSALISHALRESLALPAGPVDSSLGDLELRLTAVQRPGGALTVGEARSYEEPFDFDVAERPATALLDKLATMLGTSAPTVARHWTGTVRECIDGRLWFRDNLDETVALVTGANQRGITMAPAIATDTFDWLLLGIDSGATRPGAMSR